jgi:hypothetical protein
VRSLIMVFFTPKHVGAFNVYFNTNLNLFLRLSNCGSVGEKTVILIKMHGMYLKITL